MFPRNRNEVGLDQSDFLAKSFLSHQLTSPLLPPEMTLFAGFSAVQEVKYAKIRKLAKLNSAGREKLQRQRSEVNARAADKKWNLI